MHRPRRTRSTPSATPTVTTPGEVPRLHPRNRHQGHYDFARLVAACPELASCLITTAHGTQSIDFADPVSVRTLNRALLQSQYGIREWILPDDSLCPPIPGRADYLHHLADMLADDNAGQIPRGDTVRVLDIGTGASCIYPLLGHVDYGWAFVGSDIDSDALAAAGRIIDANPGVATAVTLRHQPERGKIFAGLLRDDERFDLTLCNPPFHASAEEATRAAQRKQRNLASPDHLSAPLSFGGRPNELWCTGGEASFVRRMINESAPLGDRVCWFSSLVSKAENLPDIQKQLKKLQARAVRVCPMAQGNKQSRFVAWSFLDDTQRRAWRT